MAQDPPRIRGVLETALYYQDQAEAERFYSDVLGIPLIGKEPDRSLFYRVGSTVLLLFDPKITKKAGTIPAHGAEGAGHLCFVVAAEDYERWRTRLAEHGVERLQELDWPGGRSFFFRDPSGNLLEIANHDIWPA